MNYDALKRNLIEYLNISYAELGILAEKGKALNEKGQRIRSRIEHIKALLKEGGWVEDLPE